MTTFISIFFLSFSIKSDMVNGDISGKIFEDINYGGGDGRNYNIANASAQSSGWNPDDIGVENVRVELYDGSGDLIRVINTDANGNYSFTSMGAGDYFVRVVNKSVISNRSSLAAGEVIIPIQTFRSNGTTDIINEVGGADPFLEDYGSNSIAVSANLSTLTTATTTPQSVTPVTVGGTNLTGIDFGYNFDVIVNTNNDGQGSLRQFIHNSNDLANTNLDQEDSPTNGVSFPKDPDWETSIFMIPGSGVHIIEPQSTLRSIRDPKTHISGYTQAGSSQGTKDARIINIELTRSTTGYDGLTIFTSDVQVSGLSIHSFRNGIFSNLTNSENNFIWGNYIGLEADGVTPGVNSGSGIQFRGVNNSFIGTNGDNINDANEGNVITSSFDGITPRNTTNLLIAGNYIGIDKTGSIDLGNRFIVIFLRDATGPNYVGFKDDLANTNAGQLRNVISGNGTDGVRIFSSDNQVISGNYLGTDVSGMAPIANLNYGVQIQGLSSNNIIGTNSNGDDDLRERNIISGNGNGFRFLSSGTGSDNIIAGNFIGTDVTGNTTLPNEENGINLEGDYSNTIVGTNGDNINDEIERNIISGNLGDGIRVILDSSIIAGNFIGVGYDGTTPLGNGRRGVFISILASNNIIGYSLAMANTDELIVGNKIMHNNDTGVAIAGTGTQNRISRNQLANNSTLGIDLEYNLVSTNDNGDGDTGPNNVMNFPVLETAEVLGNLLTITGFAPAGSEIEFFIADNGPNPDPLPPVYTTNFGEGAIYLFSANEGSVADMDATTGSYIDDGTGATSTKNQNRFEFTFDVSSLSLPFGIDITTTATDANNNTSEFSGWTELTFMEICDNGIDDDLDGLIDLNDPDCICCKSKAPILLGLRKN